MGHHSESGIITAVLGGTTIGLATMCVALRFWVRIFTKAGLGADDWFVFVSVVLTLITSALLVWNNTIDDSGAWVLDNMTTTHDLAYKDRVYKAVTWSIAVLYFAIVCTTKLGILLLYNRIFYARNLFRYQIMALIVAVAAFWVSCTVASLTNFVPDFIYDHWCERGALGPLDRIGCFGYNIFWLAAGACEVLLDLLILALPIQVIAFLQMSIRQKVTLAALFSLGAFVVITGLVKTVLGYAPGRGSPSYSKTEIWSTVHVSTAIISACLPIFKPLLLRVGSSNVASWLPTLVSALKNTKFRFHNSSRSSV